MPKLCFYAGIMPIMLLCFYAESNASIKRQGQLCTEFHSRHFVALRTVQRQAGVFWRLIDSLDESCTDFTTPEDLAKCMNALPVKVCIRITDAPRIGDHPDATQVAAHC